MFSILLEIARSILTIMVYSVKKKFKKRIDALAVQHAKKKKSEI